MERLVSGRGGRSARGWYLLVLVAMLAVVGLPGPSTAFSPFGRVVSWGNLGVGTSMPFLSGVVDVAAGGRHSLALKGDGTVVAWGDNAQGQATVPDGLTDVVQVAAGMQHSLALKDDGTVVAWGAHDFGQLAVPQGLSGVKQVAAGEDYSLALKDDGTVVAWGYSPFGATSVPAGLSGVTAVSAGRYHCLALKGDGTVVAWGNNADGQATVPPNLSGVVAVAAGGWHSLALKGDGTVVGWGYDLFDQATVPAGLSGVAAIAAGGYHSLALKDDGTVVAWSSYPYGLGGVPEGLREVSAIAAGDQHNLAVAVLRQPDLMISKTKRGGYIGRDVYEDLKAQTLRSRAHRATTRQLFVRVINNTPSEWDPANDPPHVIQSFISGKGVGVRFYAGTVDITKAVTSEGWAITLEPGASKTIRVDFRAKPKAPIGSRKKVMLSLKQQYEFDSYIFDQVVGVVRVVR